MTPQPLARHFDHIAPRYQAVRRLDRRAVARIARELARVAPARGLRLLDVGTGTGRYLRALTAALRRRGVGVARAVGLDASHAMLAGAFAARRGPAGRTHAGVALAEALPLATASFDAVTSFNAVHHFAIDGFVREAGRILCPGGLLVIYTRTPEQNGRTVWGEHFPGFADRETRLPTREILRAALAGAGAFARVRLRTCAWWQFTTLATLLDQARAHHYSTFCFYDPDEFEAALADFRTGVRRRFISPRDIPVRNNHVVALARRRRARGWPGRRLARALVVRLRRRLGA